MLKFTLKRKTIPVEIEGLDGRVQTYQIQELNGTQRDIYLNNVTPRFRYDEKGKVAGISDYKGLQADLVHMALVDGDGNPVSKETLQEWPASVLTEIFKQAQKLNALEEDTTIAKEAAKNA